MTVAALVLAAALAAGSEPSYLVERLVTCGSAVRRVSVFRDGVLVVASGERGKPPAVRRRALAEVERHVVQNVVEESYEALLDGRYRFDEASGDTVEIRLAPPGRPALRMVFSLTAMRPMGVGRVEQALDELELTLQEGAPQREDFTAWTPVVGERLELVDGRTVTVEEVLPGEGDLVVYLRIGSGPAAEYVFLAELRPRVARRVGP